MRKKLSLLVIALVLCASEPCDAFWLWSPDIGKWINPKNSAKDTPEEQLTWATEFYNQKNWDRAIGEFEKLAAVFPNSRLAAEGVYYIGLCWEQKGDIAKAADAFQKLVDRYPYSDRIKDAVKHEFDIAGRFASGEKLKMLGIPALPAQEKAIELYKHIVKNAPFGTYGDQAQFKLGEVYKSQGEYQEAQKAFQAVVDDYPSSDLVGKAKYQIAYCSMEASKQAQYDERSAERAIEEFEGFKNEFPADQQALDADESIKALRNKKAMTSFDIAAFYEKQKKWESAKVYYEEVIKKYPETQFAQEARKRVNRIVRERSGEQTARPHAKKFLLW